MFEEDHALAASHFAGKRLLGEECIHRIQVVAHDPCVRKMRARRHEVCQEHRAGRSRFDPDDLMVHGVTTRALHCDTWHDRSVFIHELEHTRLGERHEIVGQIARSVAFVRMRRVDPLSASDQVLRLWKPRTQTPLAISNRETARVVEVQVTGEDHVDVIRSNAGLSQGVVERARSIRGIQPIEFLGFLVAQPGVDEQRPRTVAHDQGPHRQWDSIHIVGLGLLRPECLGDDAEHGATVEPKRPVIE